MSLKQLVVFILFVCFSCKESGENNAETASGTEDLYQVSLTDLNAFAKGLTAGAGTTYEQTKSIVNWYAENFDWTATDYKKRTVKEILARKGGNCNELAMVTIATMDALGIQMRKVREVNLHIEEQLRQSTAEDKVKEYGLKASVFGRRHNDHIWIEIFDESEGKWFPADPSLGLVGEKEWLEARLGFGERYTLDPASKDMIAPFAIFAMDDNKQIAENRTQYYVVQGFKGLHHGLHRFSAWQEWVELIDFMDDKVRGAFEGTTNLHQYDKKILRLAELYGSLRSEFNASIHD